MANPSRKTLRAQSADFVRALIEKSSQKEEVLPEKGFKDVKKIEELVKNLKDNKKLKA